MCAVVRSSVFDVLEIDNRPGFIVFKITGKNAYETFQHEAGGHRIQHVPKHDRKGRTHTSNLTVAVLPEPSDVEFRLDPRDLEIGTCRGSGAGGQHRNTTDSAVQIKHKPSGLMVRCETERSQGQNKESALALLRSRLWEAKKQSVRSYYFQRDQIVDHELDRTWKLKSWLRGDWD